MRFTSFDLLHSYKFTNEIANCLLATNATKLLNYYMLDESSSEKVNHVPLTIHGATARVSSSMHPNHAEITVLLNLGHPTSCVHNLHPPAISDDHHVLPFPSFETHLDVGPVRVRPTRESSKDQTRSILPLPACSCRKKDDQRMPSSLSKGRSKEDPTMIDVSSLLPVPLQGRPGVWKGSSLAWRPSPDRVMITT